MLTLRKKLKSTLLIIFAISLLATNVLARPGRSSRGKDRNRQRKQTKAVTEKRETLRTEQTKRRTTARVKNNRPANIDRPNRSQSRGFKKSGGRNSFTPPNKLKPAGKTVHSRIQPARRTRPSARAKSNRTVTRTNSSPKVSRNVFVSKNKHKQISPVKPSKKHTSSKVITNKVERKVKTVRQGTANKRKVHDQTPKVLKSKTRTTTTFVKKVNRAKPERNKIITNTETIRRNTNVRKKTNKRTPTVRQSKTRSTTTVIRKEGKVKPNRNKNVTRTKARTTNERRTVVNESPKHRSGNLSKRSFTKRDSHREERVQRKNRTGKNIRKHQRRNSNVNVRVNKNITINKNVVVKNKRHHRPVVRTKHPVRHYRHKRRHSRGYHDVKVVKHVHFHHHRHEYRRNRVFKRIIWPSYRHKIYYNWRGRGICRYYRPYYHKKYVFVSIGGYWPSYTYVRYYNYGWHPYKWYGSYPTAYEISSPTYKYYTYNNYYYDNGSEAASTVTTNDYYTPLPAVSHTTFEDVREKLSEQAAQQPDSETLVDKLFSDGVTAFENEDYQTAAKAFAEATTLDPNDVVLPFAYVQALFALEQYSKATDILRLALAAMPVDQQGLFFPRGLYKEDEILINQVKHLAERAQTFTFDLDMTLLLGYQYLGIEEYDKARHWLEKAGQYDYNEQAVEILMKLLDLLQERQASAAI